MATTTERRRRSGPAPTRREVDLVFEALSHEVRRQIVLVLAHQGPELPSGYLASRFSHSWPTTTRHLRVLEAAGLVAVRHEGRNAVYRLERDHLTAVLGGWLGFLDAPNSDTTWRSPGPRATQRKAAR